MAVLGARWQIGHLVVFAALLVCGIVAIESTRLLKEAHGTFTRDLQSVWYLAAAITLPPAYALIAPIPMAAYRLWRVRNGLMWRRVFSNATISLAYGSASLLFHALPQTVAGHRPGSGSHVLTWTAVVAACALVAWVINHGLLLAGIKLADAEVRVRDLLGSRESITSDMLEMSLAISLTLVVAIDPVLMALALPSVVFCRRYLMRAQLTAQARIDELTGLLNAATWHREAEFELLRAVQGRTPLALAMVVIDHFKDMNQTAGQAVRDQLLRDVAAMLKEELPGHDLIGRFDSEEFAILLPQTGRDEAKHISERLRDHVAGEPIAIESGNHAGYVFRLTVSIGVAVLNESRRVLSELVDAADSALGQATRTGWNKVCVLTEGSGEVDESQGHLDTW